MNDNPDLSVIIPALDEVPDPAGLLARLRSVLDEAGIRYEIIIIALLSDSQTGVAAVEAGARVVEQREPGYGGALLTGFGVARGAYLLTMDADLSQRPDFIHELWRHRHAADVIVASRYMAGSSRQAPLRRYLLSRGLNGFFSRGLSLAVRDISSGLRLYKSEVIRGQVTIARDLDILPEILVRAHAEGWKIQEIPFKYRAGSHARAHPRTARLPLAYLSTFWALWKLRNSISSADYDDRAYDSSIPLQRYWQRSRFRHITGLIANQGPVLDVGCGSSRIISALPQGSVALDISLRKLRYARKFAVPLVQGSGFSLPFRDGSFPLVLCSQVIEHVPKESPMLDELCRVLAPGGLLVLGTPDYGNWQWVLIEKIYGLVIPGGYEDEHISRYTRRELMKIFKARGFKLLTTRYILRGELIMGFRKGA